MTPESPKALMAAGVKAANRGEIAAAVELFIAVGASHPGNKTAVQDAAKALRALGEPRVAAAVLEIGVQHAPRSWALLDAMAGAYTAAGMVEDASNVLQRTAVMMEDLVAAAPSRVAIWIDLGKLWTKLNQWPAAENAYRKAVAVAPQDAGAALHLGALLMTVGKLEEARQHLNTARALDAASAMAHLNAARVEFRLGNFAEAIAASTAAIALAPDLAEAHQILGTALLETEHTAEARIALNTAADLQPESIGTLINLARAESLLGRAGAAEIRLMQALSLDPNNVRARSLLDGGADAETGAEAKSLLQQAWAADHGHSFQAARESYDAVLAKSPGHAFALSRLLTMDGIEGRLDDATAHHRLLTASLAQANLAAMSWMHLAVVAYQAVLRPLPQALSTAVAAAMDRQLTAQAKIFPPAEQAPLAGRRLKVGYLSSMLRDHPIGHVTAALFGAHDRAKFDVHVFYLPEGNDTSFTQIIASSVEHFITLPDTTEAMTQAIAARDLDVLVYLDGYMSLALLPVMAARPARTQVFWLGHAGNCDISAIDYVLADATVVPPGEEHLYTAKVERLPVTYHCASPHPIGAPMTRAEAGLPPEGFVFCAFNNPEKIDARVFAVWMRILARTPGSVLWLSRTLSPSVEENLRAAARAARIDGQRLIFAARLPDKARHLARHLLCGLFLDTLTLNASTTALDALWSGLPLLTVTGDRFGAWIAASFLKALGLADMIAADLQAYEDRAVHLATHPDALGAIHSQLAANLETQPLFKIESFCRALEASLQRICLENRQDAPT